MNLARASVGRPIFTTMLTLMVVVLGSVSLSRLQIDLLPSIELPTLTVRTQYEGADPIVMERLVTQIVEEIVSTVPGVEELTSTSYEGNSSVKVKFSWGTDIDAAAVDVRATLEDEISELPDDIVGPRGCFGIYLHFPDRKPVFRAAFKTVESQVPARSLQVVYHVALAVSLAAPEDLRPFSGIVRNA